MININQVCTSQVSFSPANFNLATSIVHNAHCTTPCYCTLYNNVHLTHLALMALCSASTTWRSLGSSALTLASRAPTDSTPPLLIFLLRPSSFSAVYIVMVSRSIMTLISIIQLGKLAIKIFLSPCCLAAGVKVERERLLMWQQMWVENSGLWQKFLRRERLLAGSLREGGPSKIVLVNNNNISTLIPSSQLFEKDYLFTPGSLRENI